ncbi:hypothetical protein BU25DRAFT_204694 [Macroventuria anomochaeta]|uniref:Uncharacterized protein n=1 Tax=Macroventuria anomochaeta TaxID=301207 RepID=A0ACB6RL85_9PLEO|nr:uncharacterized protein BU25DRAFT_204694 [Macroventuria anomochaeta]KAF2622715.1 hypothetical protein BU25DRAFT_204694 [Macroventuria anomochaeta]
MRLEAGGRNVFALLVALSLRFLQAVCTHDVQIPPHRDVATTVRRSDCAVRRAGAVEVSFVGYDEYYKSQMHVCRFTRAPTRGSELRPSYLTDFWIVCGVESGRG